jgi:putative transport protein
MSGSPELLATMAVIAAGAMLGRIRLRGVGLDVAAMFLVGVAVAHYGITLSPSLGLFGLLLFLYVVGVKTGPAMRGMHRTEVKLAGTGVGLVLTLTAATVLAAWAAGLPLVVGLGSFFGFCGSGAALALLGPANAGGAAAGFAVSAPIGAVLVMVLVQVWRARSTTAIATEIDAWNAQMVRNPEHTQNATIRIERQEIAECTLKSLRPPCLVLWIERDGVSFAAEASTKFQPQDLAHVSGTLETVRATAALFGKLLPPRGPRPSDAISVRKFFVSNAAVIGVRLDSLQLRMRYSATVTRVHRAEVSLLARPGLRFRWGDRVQASVPTAHVDELGKLLGDDAHGLEEFAFPRAALTIFAGGLLGSVPIHLGDGGSLRVGPAVGVLVVSMFTAALHRTGPVIWSQSGPTLRTLSHVGLPLFLAQVGNASYAGLTDALSEYGYRLFVVAAVPLLLLAGLSLLVARFSKLGRLTLLSLLPSAAMNTPALEALQEKYRERIPGHVYAAVYPFAMLTALTIALVVSIYVGHG